MNKQNIRALFIGTSTNIKESMKKLDETAEKILFVVDENDKLLGTVTDGDIRRGLLNGLKFDASVEKVMSVEFTYIPLEQADNKGNIKKLMLENKFEQIPILDSEGILKDVILWTDILGEKSRIESRTEFPNQVVIMAGGQGTRLGPFTKILPKPLVPIGNRPIIEIIMERFYQSGFSKFVYTLNYKKEYMKLYLKECSFPYTINWVEEGEYRGTAGGIALLKDVITETFFVSNCDSLLEIDFTKAMKWHKEQNATITVIGCYNEVEIPFGVLEMSKGRLANIEEKPTHDVLINTGVYIMEPNIISLIPEKGKIDMDWLLKEVAKESKISVYPIYRGWFDVGRWEEYVKSIENMKEY